MNELENIWTGIKVNWGLVFIGVAIGIEISDFLHRRLDKAREGLMNSYRELIFAQKGYIQIAEELLEVLRRKK